MDKAELIKLGCLGARDTLKSELVLAWQPSSMNRGRARIGWQARRRTR